MDILFVHPNSSKKVYQDLSKDFSAIEPPIWAAMLSKYVADKGFDVQLLDCEALRISSEQAAQTILDRVGLGKADRLDVNHKVEGGIFVLPAKEEVVINAEAQN